MADVKDSKVAKVEIKPIPADRDGLLTSWVAQSSELAERATATFFGVARDARGELNERALATLSFIEGAQNGMWKLVRGVNERVARLTDESIDAAENLTLGVIRTLRDTGRGVTDLAASVNRPREAPRASA